MLAGGWLGVSTRKPRCAFCLWLKFPHNMVSGFQKRKREKEKEESGRVVIFFWSSLGSQIDHFFLIPLFEAGMNLCPNSRGKNIDHKSW